MSERVFAILGVGVRLRELETDPLRLPSIAGRVISLPWLPRDDDDRDSPRRVEYLLQFSQHWRLAVAFGNKAPTGTGEKDAQRVADAARVGGARVRAAVPGDLSRVGE